MRIKRELSETSYFSSLNRFGCPQYAPSLHLLQSFMPTGINIYEHGASCMPISPGQGKPISTFFVKTLSGLSRYAPTMFRFHS
jgi:hypothetical protein